MIENISRYVAIGDSFTEGLWDPAPGEVEQQRGWADRLADSLSRRRTDAGLPALEYANLAVRGKLLREILEEQLPMALDLKPHLISIIGGGNDILRPGTDPDDLGRALEKAVITARRAGIRVLLGNGMDPIGLPLVRRTRGKVATYTAHVWAIAQAQGAAVLDVWGLHALKHPHMWADDHIHLSPLGHHRVAQGALHALGLTPDDPEWRTALPDLNLTRAQTLQEYSQWVRTEVAPWVGRRLRGTSSGDGRTGKYPTPILLEAPASDRD